MSNSTIKCPKCHEVFQVDEAGYAAIVKQVRDAEFKKDLQEKEAQFAKEKEDAVKIAKLEAEQNFESKLGEKDKEISNLEHKLEEKETAKELAIQEIAVEKSQKIAELTSRIDSFNKDKQIEINEIVFKKDKEISNLRHEMEAACKNFEIQKQKLNIEHEIEIRRRDEEIASYKDYKAKLSVKLLGESLEQHCVNSFEQIRPVAFQHAYFEKDNDAKEGSKGDFVFRDYDESGCEIISIMFEMKNEADVSSTKKKNEDFFKKLDKDRKEKKCEYAVLVSVLEPESELYNCGIVDVSHRYEKMYVIRPQFFIQLIGILRKAAMNSLQYKKELERMRAENFDMTQFENALFGFKEDFSKYCTRANNKFQDAIKEIDKAIANLQKTKEALLSSENNLRIANNKTEALTIKKLAKNSPSILTKLNEENKDNKKKK